jgi:beta-glucosidase
MPAKHYNCNHRENGRETNNITISQKLLMEQAGLQFRTAVQEGGALSVMNAYNLVNGLKSAHNPSLLTTILRTSWGFPFYVVSDWGAIWNAENAIEAGTDICMGSDHYQNNLPSLVSSGAVTMPVLDAAVRRVLRTKALAGLLDYLPPGNPSDLNSTEHQQLCLEAGRKSIVLLKNEENILPLNPDSITTVAVIGPNAPVAPIDGSGSSYVTPVYSVTPLQGVTRILGSARVRYAKGCDINSADTTQFAAALSAASGADAVLFFGGLDPSQEGEGFDRVGGSIDLPGKQQDLINRLASVNPKIIVSLFSGGICGIQRAIANIKGLIYGFYPGQEVGNAVAEVIFGAYNPGGKLPVTFPFNTSQLPAWNDNLNDDYGGGYRWFEAQSITPQFAFGSD